MIFTYVCVSGCATTQLTPEQCASQNWEQLGRTDGEKGRSGNYFGHYLSDCHNISVNQPHRQLWEQGRQQGLKSYCTELMAYKTGREGYQWQAVCPIDNINKLEEAYREGRENYLREQYLNNWYDDDYPWGFRRHSFWGRPYWDW